MGEAAHRLDGPHPRHLLYHPRDPVYRRLGAKGLLALVSEGDPRPGVSFRVRFFVLNECARVLKQVGTLLNALSYLLRAIFGFKVNTMGRLELSANLRQMPLIAKCRLPGNDSGGHKEHDVTVSKYTSFPRLSI